MANPVISIGPQGSGRYASPNFAPIAQGWTTLGAGIGGAFREQRKRAEKEKADAALQAVFAGARKPDGTVDPQGVLGAIFSNPKLLGDPRAVAGLNALHLWNKKPKRETLKGADGYTYYLDTGERALPHVQKSAGSGQTMTSLQKNLAAAGFKPGTPEFQAELRKHLVKSPPTDTGALLKRIGELKTMDRTPEQEDEYNALRMRVRFGGKPPEAYVKARSSLGDARVALNNLYGLMQRGDDNPLKPSDRKRMGQHFSSLKLAFADLLNRGANFTDTEQALIGGVIGGDPNDLWNRFVSGDEAFRDRLKTTAKIIEARARGLIDSFTKPDLPDFTYAWDQKGAAAPKAGAGVVDRAADAVGLGSAKKVKGSVMGFLGLDGKKPATAPTAAPAANAGRGNPPAESKGKKPPIPTSFEGMSVDDLMALGDRVNDMGLVTVHKYMAALRAAKEHQNNLAAAAEIERDALRSGGGVMP